MLGYFNCPKGYRASNIEIRIVKELIRAKFDDKLNLDNSKLVGKFVDLEVSFSISEGKKSEVKDWKMLNAKVFKISC